MFKSLYSDEEGATRYAVLFLGAKEIFQQNYESLMQYYEDKIRKKAEEARKKDEAENEVEELEEGAMLQEEDNEDDSDDEDTETKFLKQFPAMSGLYK